MMIRVLPIALAVALAAGGAIAQERDATYPAGGQKGTVQRSDDGRTTGQKMKDGMHRLGDKTKRLFGKGKDKVEDGTAHAKAKAHGDDRNDTKSMGASGHKAAKDAKEMRSDDSSRRERMDDAYANWKSGQAKR